MRWFALAVIFMTCVLSSACSGPVLHGECLEWQSRTITTQTKCNPGDYYALCQQQYDQSICVRIRCDEGYTQVGGKCVKGGKSDSYSQLEPPNLRMFKEYGSGVVLDIKTELEWFAGPNKNTNWHDAKTWVENLKVAGGGWRMPTREELKKLHREDLGIWPLSKNFERNGIIMTYVWSGEKRDSSTAWCFAYKMKMDGSNKYFGSVKWWGNLSDDFFFRTLAVRSRKQ